MTPAPITPPPHHDDAGLARVVVDYRGMQILDARERIQIVIPGEPPRGVRRSLKNEGFTARGNGTWDAPHTPMSIAAAQAIGNAFFQEQETK